MRESRNPMPKQKTHSGAKKRFKVSAAGKVLRSRRHRTTPPGHLVKSQAKRKRARRNGPVAPSDAKSIKKLLGLR
jgi:large subunit ribosomal protein L35